jgi:hypothetical protein
MQLGSAVNALAVYAPVVVMGRAEHETCLKALIAGGSSRLRSTLRRLHE